VEILPLKSQTHGKVYLLYLQAPAFLKYPCCLLPTVLHHGPASLATIRNASAALSADASTAIAIQESMMVIDNIFVRWRAARRLFIARINSEVMYRMDISSTRGCNRIILPQVLEGIGRFGIQLIVLGFHR
jgi:hypothetical protein